MTEPHHDIATLAAHASQCALALQTLPPRPDRDDHQRRTADDALARCRAARSAFMRDHGDWLYDQLTERRTVALRLNDLLERAGELVPGLLPTASQWARESACLQADKEGWEIDQGIFFWGVLRQPACGDHLVRAMLEPSRAALARLEAFRDTGSADLGPVLIERRGAVAHLTVVNETGLNAEDNALAEAMETAVDLALLDEQVRVGVVRGGTMTHPKYLGRRVFCSGINLNHLFHGHISFVDFLLRREFGYVHKIRRGLCRSASADTAATDACFDKPWVAAVDTFAIGGGLQLVLAFDHVVAERDAYFVLPAAKEGIIPGSANLRLGLRAGGRVARDMILRGATLSATDAAAAGLVDSVADPADMDAAIDAAVQAMSREALAPNRRLINLVEEPMELFRSYMAEFALLQSQRIYAPDVIERLRNRWAA